MMLAYDSDSQIAYVRMYVTDGTVALVVEIAMSPVVQVWIRFNSSF